MTNRRTLTFSIFAAAILGLALPVLAVAQGGYGYPDYGRNRNGSYGRYEDRFLRDSIHRLDRLSKDFERDVDRALDRSRVDGTRREDQINTRADRFRHAVGNLKSAFGNGRDLNRSRDEAQRVLQEAQQFDRIGRSRVMNNRVASAWSQIQQELRVISSAYGLGYGGYNNGGYQNGRNDDYRRNDRNRNRNNNNDWRRNIPWPY